MTNTEQYHLDRANADSSRERRTVWRMYAYAVIQTFAERTDAKVAQIDVRPAEGDGELPYRFKPYWRALSDDELRALWRALERARQK